MDKRKFRPIWFLIIGIFLLIVPTIIYLCFLIPEMKEEYIVLMSSAGIVGGGAVLGINYIPEKARYGALFKTASKSFTTLVCLTLVQDFLPQILGLIATIIVSYIVFIIFRGLWKDGRQRELNKKLAQEITRSITEDTK